jgi:acyl carrier protein
MPESSKLDQQRLRSKIEIQAWLITQIAGILFLDPNTIDPEAPFSSYGLSSRDAVLLSGDLEEWLDRRLSPTLIYEYPSIEVLSTYLSGEDIASSQIATMPLNSHQPEKFLTPQYLDLDDKLTSLEELSDEEAEALLVEKLNQLRK